MERFYAFSVFLLVFCSRIYVADAEDESMWMPDPNLRSAVRTTLNLNADEALTQENILKLTGLNAPKLGITDLTGLEHATYLKSLLISGNQIRNIKPLANLRYLTRPVHRRQPNQEHQTSRALDKSQTTGSASQSDQRHQRFGRADKS